MLKKFTRITTQVPCPPYTKINKSLLESVYLRLHNKLSNDTMFSVYDETPLTYSFKSLGKFDYWKVSEEIQYVIQFISQPTIIPTNILLFQNNEKPSGEKVVRVWTNCESNIINVLALMENFNAKDNPSYYLHINNPYWYPRQKDFEKLNNAHTLIQEIDTTKLETIMSYIQSIGDNQKGRELV